jgi:hypothetical protein
MIKKILHVNMIMNIDLYHIIFLLHYAEKVHLLIRKEIMN